MDEGKRNKNNGTALNAECNYGNVCRVLVNNLFPISVTTMGLIKAFLCRFPQSELSLCWWSRSWPAGGLNNSRSEPFQVFVGGSRVVRGVHLQIDVRQLLQSQTAWRPPLHLRTGTEVNVKDVLLTKNFFAAARLCCYVSWNQVFLLPKPSDGVYFQFLRSCTQINSMGVLRSFSSLPISKS